VGDARSAFAAGADAAGLVRTEFLFLSRDRAPSVNEQEAEYLALAAAIGGRRITLRTLDVGGDKPLPYVFAPVEQNPFLGRRGIRLALEQRELLTEQLEAICRTARQTPTSVMFPMVSTVQELLDSMSVLRAAAGAEGTPPDLRIGMMVEVPAAALKIETFLPHLDFVSIGTNDLTQYTLAAERGNPAVAALSDALDPGVLQLIAQTCHAARGRVPVAVCGEAASDATAVAILLGLGVRELSVAPAAVPRIKTLVRGLDLTQCVTLAEKALTLRNANDVRQLVSAELGFSG
jgi:multiphosphoryl transfer protein